MKYKIVKRIHSYSNNPKVEFIIFKKTLFGWTRSSHQYNKYLSYEIAETELMKYLSKGLGGIIEVDGNVYELFPLSLPTP